MTPPSTPAPPVSSSRGLTAAVVAVIAAAIGILLVLAFIIGPLTSGPPPEFSLSVVPPVGGSGFATIAVVNASPVMTPASFRVNVSGAHGNGTSQPMPKADDGSVTVQAVGMAYRVYWNDSDKSASLTAGDRFYVAPLGGSTEDYGTRIRFWLLRFTNATLASVEWTIPLPAPVVTLSAPIVTSLYAYFYVAGASTSAPISAYKFNLMVNGSVAPTAVALAAGTNQITVASVTYWVNYTDIAGNGMLKAGDVIRIAPQPAGSSFATGAYTFILIWASSGSQIQTASWSI